MVEELSSTIKDAESVVFANFHGLSVDDANRMRREFREKGVGYKVFKKTLAKRAFADSGIKGELPEWEGELAIAWGDDPVVPAGSIYAFQKELDGAVSITGGVFEGEYKDKEGMMEIALIPPMETLRAMFVNLINSPIQGFVVALNEIAQQGDSA